MTTELSFPETPSSTTADPMPPPSMMSVTAGETTANPYTDTAALLRFYTTFRDECSEDRVSLERDCQQKLLYLMGRQWIDTDRRGQWRDKRIVKWMPRPVTNVVFTTAEIIRSVFDSVQLGVKVRPQGDDPVQAVTADLADNLEPAIAAEHEWPKVQREADFWLSVLHNVFLYTWWDKGADTNGTITIPYEQCAMCQGLVPAEQTEGPCPTCQGTQYQKQQPAEGQAPEGVSARVGRGRTDVCSPLEVLVPPKVTKFADVLGVIRRRWRTKRWWEAQYPALAKTLTYSQSPSARSMQMLQGLATMGEMSGSGLANLGVGGESGAGSEGAIEDELWYKPCAQYPEGLFLRVVGDTSPQIVTDPKEGTPGPLPSTTADGRRLFPWVMERFSSVGGRLWARGPMDVLLQKQDQLNQIDALIQLIIQRCANPIWLQPEGAQVTQFTGEPGIVVKWNPLAAGGTNAKPERIPGENVPGSLLAIRKQILDDIQFLTGTNDPLSGQKPSGVDSFSGMQLMVERAQSRFSGVLKERGEGYRQWYALALELERQYGPPERVQAVLGPNMGWTFQQFKNADLQGSVEVLVEDGSHAPKTNLGKRAAIEHANQLKLMDPQDPDLKYAIYQDLGIAHLLPAMDANISAALQEQEAFERWLASGAQGQSPLVVQYWHKDAIHLSEHGKWANGDAMRELLAQHPDAVQVLTDHFQGHEMAAMLKELPPPQRAQIAQRGAGLPPAPDAIPGQQPGPAQAAGAGRTMANSNQESGPMPMPPPTAGQATNQRPGVM